MKILKENDFVFNAAVEMHEAKEITHKEFAFIKKKASELCEREFNTQVIPLFRKAWALRKLRHTKERLHRQQERRNYHIESGRYSRPMIL